MPPIERPMTPSRTASSYFLYLIQLINRVPYTKIGISHDPISRLHALEVASPFSMRIHAVGCAIMKPECDRPGLTASLHKMRARTAEKELHDLCHPFHAKGEWFSMKPKDVVSISDAAFNRKINQYRTKSVFWHLDPTKKYIDGLITEAIMREGYLSREEFLKTQAIADQNY